MTLSDTSGGGVTVTSLSNGGGRFRATIGDISAAIWCVDDQLPFTPGESVLGNVLSFSDINAATPLAGAPPSYRALGASEDVRYETVTTTGGVSGWQQNIAAMASQIGASGGSAPVVAALGNTALFRYKAVAWLITQFDDPGLVTNSNNTHNLVIYEAIWEMLDVGLDNYHYPVEGSTNWFTTAIRYVSNNWNSSMWNEWRIVSAWIPSRSGGPGVADGGANIQRQTFLTQVSPTPEPGSLALFGLGIGGLIALGYRRSKSALSSD